MNQVFLSGIVGVDITTKSFENIDFENTEIVLNTVGGSLYESWAIHDQIKGKVKSIGVAGMCASAGIQILLASPERWATKNSRLLIHNPTYRIDGDADAHIKAAESLKSEQDILNQRYSEILGMSIDEIEAITSKDMPLIPEQAISINLITNIRETMDVEKSQEMVNQFENKLESFFSKMKNFFSPKNLMKSDVNGKELNFEGIETIDQINEGTTVTVDGAPASGNYITADGTEYTCEGGKVVSIKKVEANPMEVEIETLKKDLETKANEVTNLSNSLNDLQNKYNEAELHINSIKSEFVDFKNQFSTGKVTGAAPEKAKTEVKKNVLTKDFFDKL